MEQHIIEIRHVDHRWAELLADAKKLQQGQEGKTPIDHST